MQHGKHYPDAIEYTSKAASLKGLALVRDCFFGPVMVIGGAKATRENFRCALNRSTPGAERSGSAPLRSLATPTLPSPS